MHPMLFYPLSFLVIASAIFMIFQRHPLTAAASLVVCFLGLAGLYGLLSAPLLAIFQVLVYAGAIMALVVFVCKVEEQRALFFAAIMTTARCLHPRRKRE